MQSPAGRDALPADPPKRTVYAPVPEWVKSGEEFEKVVRTLRGKLHRAAPGAVCRCGPCSHQLRAAEQRLGAPAGALRGWLTTKKPQRVAPAPPRRPLTSSVGSSAHVVVNGERLPLVAGLSALAQALSEKEASEKARPEARAARKAAQRRADGKTVPQEGGGTE